jgi:hypothetical protein
MVDSPAEIRKVEFDADLGEGRFRIPPSGS